MVKETSRETNMKKKRKSANVGEGDTDVDVYKKSVQFEEKEAMSRSSDVDSQLYFETCKQIRDFLGEISELKSKHNPDARAKISDKTTAICLCIVLLKKLNRMEKVRSVFPKEQLTVEKQKVDSINLQYQNLLYEANHLTCEYRKCFQFKSKDEEIELVPVDEFLLEAPENLTKKFFDFDEKDENLQHELRLARLEWELQQRIHLADKCKELEEEKKKLEGDIAERKSKLDKLGPLLSTVMEATKPVQEHLGLDIDKTLAEHKLASLLPDPLYVFYANVDAYRKVNDQSMNVSIVGDQDEASHFNELQQSDSPIDEFVDDDDDDDDNDDEDQDLELETQESEEIVETKKRRHRKSVQVDPLEEKKKKLLEVHPLSIQVTAGWKDGPSIVIKFSYYTKLRVVTTCSEVDIPDTITGHSAREVLSNESVLVELLAKGDFGLDSPNPCTQYQLKKVGFKSFQSLIPDLGYVYGWAQKVCGLDFLEKHNANKLSEQLSFTNVELVLRTIKNRLKYRFILSKQLEELERNIIPEVPKTVELPKTTISTLTKWTTSTYQAFCQAKFTQSLVESEFISTSDIFYNAIISRGLATLQAFVVVKNDYPSTPPMFALSLSHNGIKNGQNDDDIRDMERVVNVDWNREFLNATWLLSAQILSLCACLDIYLETEDGEMFPQNTMYIKASRGKNRRKPFKYRNIGVGVFTQ